MKRMKARKRQIGEKIAEMTAKCRGLERKLDDLRIAAAEVADEKERLEKRCKDLERDAEVLNIAVEAGSYASDRLAERCKALEGEIEAKDAEIWALKDQLERTAERAGYPVDVDPVLAERLQGANEELREALRSKEEWCVELIDVIKGLRAEMRALDGVIADAEAENAQEETLAKEYYNAFGVIAGIANRMMQVHLKGEDLCSD